MLVGELRCGPAGDGAVERRARLTRGDGWTHEVRVRAPAARDAPPDDDATAALPLALLCALKLGEDLEVDGRVDSELYARLDDVQAVYRAMDPALGRRSVRVAGLLEGRPSGPRAVCISRGVDSTYAAARRATPEGPIEAGVHIAGLEPLNASNAATDRDHARGIANLLDLPLIEVDAPDLRPAGDDIMDWEDAVAAGLAWVAHSLAGTVARLVIPSTDSIDSLGPRGTSPVLDPLLSSSAVAIEHAPAVDTRMGKVAWLVAERPDLLPHVKVCHGQNRADNCGACPKCVVTMACLRAAGALEIASGFPPWLDVELVRALRLPTLDSQFELSAVADAALAAGDRELADAARDCLHATARARMVVSQRIGPPTFRAGHGNAVIGLVREGRSDRRAGLDGSLGRRGPGIGLVRGLDLRARRHGYTAGRLPAGAVTAELGALEPWGVPDAPVPLWTLPDGRVVAGDERPRVAAPSVLRRARFCAEPLAAPLAPVRRLALALRRALDLALIPPPGPARRPAGEPDGYLYETPAPDRVPLWSAVHPVTGDQLLASTPDDARRAGYGDATLLGHLAARAPVTGRLGVHATPIVPWARQVTGQRTS